MAIRKAKAAANERTANSTWGGGGTAPAGTSGGVKVVGNPSTIGCVTPSFPLPLDHAYL